MELYRDQATWKNGFVRHGYITLVETEEQGDLERKESRLDRIERLGRIFYAGIAPSMDDPLQERQQELVDELEVEAPATVIIDELIPAEDAIAIAPQDAEVAEDARMDNSPAIESTNANVCDFSIPS